MTDIVYDSLAAGIDMMIAATMFTMVVILLRGSNILLSYNTVQQTNANRVNYYKEYSMYDNKNGLSSADALSCIVYYKGEIEVVIKLTNGVQYYTKYSSSNNKYNYYKSTSNSPISYDELKTAIGSERVFSSRIYEDLSNTPSTSYKGGTITKIMLTEY